MIIWSAGHDEADSDTPDSKSFRTRAEAVSHMVWMLRQVGDDFSSGYLDQELGDHSKEYWDAADALAQRGDGDGDWYADFEDGRVTYWVVVADLPEKEALGFLEYDDWFHQRSVEAASRLAAIHASRE